jgi:hypothetical protein
MLLTVASSGVGIDQNKDSVRLFLKTLTAERRRQLPWPVDNPPRNGVGLSSPPTKAAARDVINDRNWRMANLIKRGV